MGKSITFSIIFLIVGLLTSCPGAIDSLSWKELGNGYIYHEPAGMPTIGKINGDKGINGWIFDYDYNSEFIVALEKFINTSEEKKELLISSGDYYNFLKKSGYSKYWIVAHANDSIYGPFSLEEYLQKREELGVPKQLKLKE